MNASSSARRRPPRRGTGGRADAPEGAPPPGLAARQAAATLLARVVDDRRSLSGLVDTRHGPSAFQALEARDQALARAIVTAALRHRGTIESVLSHAFDRAPPKRARHLIHTLHVAAAQILFLDVPDRAAVSLAVEALRREPRSARFAGLANAVLRKVAAQGVPTDARPSGVPDWWARRMGKQWGRERAAAILAAQAKAPAIDLCCPHDAAGWASRLGGTHLFGACVRVERGDPVTAWPGFEEGAWWVQDAAAQLPAALLGDVSGERVLDLCAAPGGKAAQLIAAGARLTAVEMVPDRAARLRANLARLSLSATIMEADLMEWAPEEPFGAILLDAPCSSTGTARRHPDIPWTKTADDIEALARLQEAMLRRAATFLAPGGRLVFANCSLDRTEGEDVLARVTGDGTFVLDPVEAHEVHGLAHLVNPKGWVRSLPAHPARPLAPGEGTLGLPEDPATGLDGFFAARLHLAAPPPSG